MDEEIKLEDAPVQQSLNELKSTIEAMEHVYSKNVSGDSNMEVVEKLRQMKQQMDVINRTYQTVLRENTESANLVLEKLKETDRTAAYSFQLLK
ncbi:DUF5344 family protein [Virgibacillus sp. YIM 98842]|jgi:predicted translin family RNA/ssDNA-binding protein|uniref:DUF5344 family protein n=1 Tax=Virgibacillus sp. YIM 98842 TaxID=2663533 RepID=UPI0013D9A1DA|nr:DUF5344 family protein [Virgibacillus sp. YIM 98842]